MTMRSFSFLLMGSALSTIGIWIVWNYYDDRGRMATARSHLQITESSPTLSPDAALYETCVLKENPTWDDEISKIINLSMKEPTAGCTPFTPLTVLTVDGRIRINPNYTGNEKHLEGCYARDLHYPLPWLLRLLAQWWDTLRPSFFSFYWRNLYWDPRFSHDFVEVWCPDRYHYIHIRVVPLPEEEKEKKDPKLFPDINIIIIDGTGNSAARRNFPKTLDYLATTFDAINFPHFYKVGHNSYPSQMGLFFGGLVVPLHNERVGGLKVAIDYPPGIWDRKCFIEEGDEFVMEAFSKKGYRTMAGEDYYYPQLETPECDGMWMTDHRYMRFHQIFHAHESDMHTKFMGIGQCREEYTFPLQYFDNFMAAYPDRHKASYIWLAGVAHDNFQNFHADKTLLPFFRKHEREWNKSFTFILSDHGYHLGGPIFETKIGRRDFYNPMLWVIVPHWTRKDKDLMKNLRENSQKFITSFDAYATFMDLAENVVGEVSPSFSTRVHRKGLKGNSLFRPLPPGPRTCLTLPIPLDYCPCEIDLIKVEDKSLSLVLARSAVHEMNGLLSEKGFLGLCSPLELASHEAASFINGTTSLYEVVVSTNPGGGRFRARIVHDGHGKSSLSGDPPVRLNSYGAQGNCIDGDLKYLIPSLLPHTSTILQAILLLSLMEILVIHPILLLSHFTGQLADLNDECHCPKSFFPTSAKFMENRALLISRFDGR